jgi:hypothetical protein
MLVVNQQRKGAIMRSIAIVLLLAGGVLAQEPAPMGTPPSGQKRNGFTLETHVGTQLVTVGAIGGGAPTAIGLFGGGFFAGYKIDRIMVGLGFDLARVATGMSIPGADTSNASTAFFITPGVRVAILRSHDQRVEMTGQFDLGLGTTTTEQSPSPMGPQPEETRFRLYYNLGPGVRFWVHPQFAIGAVTGVHGDFAYTKTTPPMSTTSTSTSSTVTSIFAALQLLGVF